jgi:apolipoprotein N-acyltransferase
VGVATLSPAATRERATGGEAWAVVAAACAALAQASLPALAVAATPVLWAVVLVSARRAGATAVVGVPLVLALPVGLALLPRGPLIAFGGLVAAMFWPVCVLAVWVALRRTAWGGVAAAATHVLGDLVPDALDLPIRSMPLLADAVLLVPECWPLVAQLGWSLLEALVIAGATALLLHRAWLPVLLPVALLTCTGEPLRPAPAELAVGYVAPQADPLGSRLMSLSLAARQRERARMESRTSSLAAEGADLVVWPENGSGAGLLDSIRHTRALDTGAATVLLGGDFTRDGESVAGTAVVARGQLVALAEKTRGVPGVEAAPRAPEPLVVDAAGVKVAPVICYGSMWRWLFRDLKARQTELVVVQSDATSFMHTSLARTHWRLTAMLALEQQLPTVFVARNGGVHAISPAARRVLSSDADDGILRVALEGARR